MDKVIRKIKEVRIIGPTSKDFQIILDDGSLLGGVFECHVYANLHSLTTVRLEAVIDKNNEP